MVILTLLVSAPADKRADATAEKSSFAMPGVTKFTSTLSRWMPLSSRDILSALTDSGSAITNPSEETPLISMLRAVVLATS